MYRIFLFFFNSIALGVGLAMDAFSVSMVNGLNEPQMRKGKMTKVAGTYAAFQFLMPMIGWIFVHTIVQYFQTFEKFIPWIALLLLLYIGGKMLLEGLEKHEEEAAASTKLTKRTLFVQGIATSIDALSVGFTIADYGFLRAFVCSVIIAAVTMVVCLFGLHIGKTVGTRLSGRAAILGGVILIAIGIEIFLSNML